MGRLVRGTVTAALAVTTAAATAVVAMPAAHAEDGDVVRRGACSDGARWELEAGPDDSGTEVEGEVDSNRAGQTWRWVMRHEGDRFASGESRTTARSGSFSVERRAPSGRGPDTYVFRAWHPATGQVCVARVTL